MNEILWWKSEKKGNLFHLKDLSVWIMMRKITEKKIKLYSLYVVTQVVIVKLLLVVVEVEVSVSVVVVKLKHK